MKILENIKLKPHSVYLKSYTTFQIGGLCRYFYEPDSLESLLELWQIIHKESLPYFILGAGSNILAKDSEIKKIIISLSNFQNISFKKNILKAQAGSLINNICQVCLEKELSGMEFFYGLPASLGGALFMNARCFGDEISENLQKVKILNSKGNLEVYHYKKEDFNYKISPFQKTNSLILEADFSLYKKSKKEIKFVMDKNMNSRKEKGHFKCPSAGSYFKNDYSLGIPSGTLIEECHLKGVSLGGAQVAPWHGNFLINKEKASAKEVLLLAQKIKETIFKEKKISLEEEVIYLE